MAHYDTMAPSYDVRYGEEQSKKHEVALQTLGNLSGEMVLDEGCGTGLLFPKLQGTTHRLLELTFRGGC